MEREYDYLFKLLLIGDSGVGKSCMLSRFADDVFVDQFISTIGVDFKIRTIEQDGKKIKLQIWDTAGQERFRTITSSYYRGAHGIITVYDVTDKDTFQHLSSWDTEVSRYASENVLQIIVGTKNDIPNKRQVAFEDGQAYAANRGLQFYETNSTRTVPDDRHTTVETIFQQLATELLQRSSGVTVAPGTVNIRQGFNGKKLLSNPTGCPC